MRYVTFILDAARTITDGNVRASEDTKPFEHNRYVFQNSTKFSPFKAKYSKITI